jgi:hypothetical protein
VNDFQRKAPKTQRRKGKERSWDLRNLVANHGKAGLCRAMGLLHIVTALRLCVLAFRLFRSFFSRVEFTNSTTTRSHARRQSLRENE